MDFLMQELLLSSSAKALSCNNQHCQPIMEDSTRLQFSKAKQFDLFFQSLHNITTCKTFLE